MSLKLPLFLTESELNSLLNIKKKKHKLGLSLMADAGLRVSEVSNLRLKDIYFDRGYIKVLGKRSKERIIPISSRLETNLKNYLSDKKVRLSADDFVVGLHRSVWAWAVKKYSRENLNRSDVHCHTLRHSFATALYQKGVTIEKLADILGHDSIDTTRIYSHLSIDQKRESISLLDPFFVRLRKKLNFTRKKFQFSIQSHENLIGRDIEYQELCNLLNNDVSVCLYGVAGVGKSSIAKFYASKNNNAFYIHEWKKKRSLVDIFLFIKRDQEPGVKEELQKTISKLNNDEVLKCFKDVRSSDVIVIDDFMNLSKADKKIITGLVGSFRVLCTSSKFDDVKLFTTYYEIKPLSRLNIKTIISEKIQVSDQNYKQKIIDEVLQRSGSNMRDVDYFINQFQLRGLSFDSIKNDSRVANQVSLAPAMLLLLFFGVAYVLKSYAVGTVAFAYALMVVFRLIFYRFLFVPALQKKTK